MRVLCYAPYNRWALHGQWEMTILHALRLRGARRRVRALRRPLQRVRQFWAAHNPRPARACLQCQADVTKLCAELGMDYRWLGRYLDPARGARRGAGRRRWRTASCRRALRGLADRRLGAQSLQSHFRASMLDVGGSAVGGRCARYLATAGSSPRSRSVGCSTRRDPDVLLLFNGRQSSLRVALGARARARHPRRDARARPAPRDAAAQVENATVLALERVRAVLARVGRRPVDADELADVAARLMVEREHGRGLPWKAFSAPPQPRPRCARALGLERAAAGLGAVHLVGRRGVAGDEDWRGDFASQRDWIERTIEHAAAIPSSTS